MPVTKQAIKKVRQDKRKTVINSRKKGTYKKAVQTARRGATPSTLSAAFKALDRASKINVIHPNKAARLKSRLSKLIGSKSTITVTPKAKKKTKVKKSSKK